MNAADVQSGSEDFALDLYWIPLGSGAHVVRTCGRAYERIAAWMQHRTPQAIYHAALVATTPEGQYSIEMTPVPRAGNGVDRGVVGEGAVGAAALGRLRIFRYELRSWLGGTIPDLPLAVGGRVVISRCDGAVRDVLDSVAHVPTPVWGRDELHLGEMWSSNSVVSWLLAEADVLDAAGEPPLEGRAPGWRAGALAAHRCRLTDHAGSEP